MPNTNSEFKDSILKTSNILYLEDENIIRHETSKILESFFNEVYVASDGLEGIELYEKYKDNIDIIITDLNMPNLDGIGFMSKVRQNDMNVPILVSTAFSDTSSIIKAIKLKVADYILKPMQLTTTLKIVYNILNDINNNKLILQQKNELENFKEALDKQNMITKTDIHGIITDANDLFCEVSGYKKDELIGQNHNIVRHPDISSDVFRKLWFTIQSGQMWIGKLKNLTKAGRVFHTKTTIIPIFALNGVITEYISMRFLTTEEEEEKQNLKRLILQQKSKELRTEQSLKEKIANEITIALKNNEMSTNIKNNRVNEFIVNLQHQLNDTRKKYADEKARVLGLDRKIKLIEDKIQDLQETSHSKLTQLHKITQGAIFKYDKIKKREMILEDKLLKAQQSITVLQNYNDEYKDKIIDLNSIMGATKRNR